MLRALACCSVHSDSPLATQKTSRRVAEETADINMQIAKVHRIFMQPRIGCVFGVCGGWFL